MLPGTIVMLLVIVCVIYGGTGFIIAKTLKNENGASKNAPAAESGKEE